MKHNKKTSYYYFMLGLILSTISFLSNTTYTKTSTKTRPESLDIHKDIHEDSAYQKALVKRILDQIHNIDLKLEEIAQATNNEAIKIKDKAYVQNRILTFRKYISSLKKKLKEHPETLPLKTIIDINKIIIARICNAFAEGFETLRPIDPGTVLKRLENKPRHYTSKKTILEHLDMIDQSLKRLTQATYKEKKNNFARFVDTTNKFLKDWHIKKAAQKTAAYGTMFSLLVINTPDEFLPEFIKNYKRILLSPLKKPREEINNISNNTGSSKKDNYINTELGIVCDSLSKSKILGLDYKTIFTLPVTGTVTPFIIDDCKRIKNYTKDKVAQLIAYLKDEKIPDKCPVKESKLNFNDIKGYQEIKEELQEIISYFNNREKSKITGIFPHKGYIFTGAVNFCEIFAKALAGQIKQTTNKKINCGIYTVTPSMITAKDKSLKKLVDDITYKGPFILVLKDLELLGNTHNFNTVTLSNFIEDLDRILNNKDKDIFVVALVEDLNNIHPVLSRADRLSSIITIGLPTNKERYAFIEKEFEKNSLNSKDFNLQIFAQKTKGLNYQEIIKLIKRTQQYAYRNVDIVTQEHLDHILATL